MSKFWAGGGETPKPPVGKTLFMNSPLSASQSVNQNHFFSKTTDRIFIKFHTNFWFLKDKKSDTPKKKSFWEKVWNILKSRAFWSWLKLYSINELVLDLLDAP